LTEDYRVTLDAFAGPMDLLLHLVRKEEVDIHDIPVARILDEYRRHLDVIQALDLDAAGEFLVMAATLMVIKSKMLLPSEVVDLEEEIDPRFELVQKLLEYKRFKDATRDLESRATAFAAMVGRPESARPEPVRGEDRSLEEVGLFDLMGAFAKILESLGADSGQKERRIRIQDRPVRVYVQDLRRRLGDRRSLLFSELMAQGHDRGDKIGYFLALLLLLKQEVVTCAQEPGFGDIRILYRGDSEEQEVAIDLADDFR
jgi:segregation and condensation protein A